MIAKSFARIHRQNLINYGILPLSFVRPSDYDRLEKGDVLSVRNLRRTLGNSEEITLECKGAISSRHGLVPKQIDVILAGGIINWRRDRGDQTNQTF